MSATRRGIGPKRLGEDAYATPGWCVERLLETLELPGGDWLEPCAGDGAIVRAVGRNDVRWTLVEVRTECMGVLSTLGEVRVGDFLSEPFGMRHWDVVLTNPPYRDAGAFLEKCLSISDVVVMLLRLNFLATEGRAGLMRANPPDVYILPNRPQFVAGNLDSIEYAWFVWPMERGRDHGRVKVLSSTVAGERSLGRGGGPGRVQVGEFTELLDWLKG